MVEGAPPTGADGPRSLLALSAEKETFIMVRIASFRFGLLLVLVALLGLSAGRSDALLRELELPPRILFQMSEHTPLEDLLPEAPEMAVPLPPWLVQELTQAPEVLFQKQPP
jgi:hypothetical protein